MKMKRLLSLTGFTLTVCALACAQDTAGDRIVVPARSSTHPRQVIASQTNGHITVKTYAGRDVIVESGDIKSRNEERTVDGMKRIDMPWRAGVSVEEDDNVITIHSGAMHNQPIVVSVPADTSLKLRCTNGGIDVDGVHGETDVSSTNGSISITNVSGTVVANTTNGTLKVTMDQVTPGKPMSFSSFNGKVDVTLPPTVGANVKLRTDRGEIWSDFDIKLTGGGQPITEKNDSPDGKYRVKFERTVVGTINGGGTEISFSTFNGSIFIRKKK
jgi:DUF4097 and DUF4098 domain-containing protein YvlB